MRLKTLIFLAFALPACAPGTPAPARPVPPAKPAPAPAPKPESLAKCLARVDAHLYGASWCHWCHVQLKLFGPDAPDVPYTDCDPQGTLDYVPECAAKGLDMSTPVPIWLFKDGSRLVGVRSLRSIALVAGCPVPP